MRERTPDEAPGAYGFGAAVLFGLALSIGAAQGKATICPASFERRYELNTAASTAPPREWNRRIHVDATWWRGEEQTPGWRGDGRLVLVVVGDGPGVDSP